MLDSLTRDHRHLANLADRLEACLDDDGPLVAMRIGQLRCALAHEAVRHTLVAERLVYRTLAARDPALFAQHGEMFPCLRTDQFLQRLERHIHRWDAPAVQADRMTHAADTRELLSQLRRRMELEEQLLYPRFRALEGVGAVRQRRRARSPIGIKRQPLSASGKPVEHHPA